ncbi:hypothetical protein KCV01_g11985, partial [Aureobasidium melanogenum]
MGPPLLFALALATACPAVRAQTVDDTRLRLDQTGERREVAREKSLVEDADTSRIVIDGKTYSVGDTASDVGEALYVSVEKRAWGDARRFLARYENMPDADPMLLHYARGGLAREDGNLAGAEREYRDLLQLQDGFLPGELELARVLFESQQDRDAEALFRRIDGQLPATDDKAAGVRKSVETFLAALKRRRAWQGSFAIGPSYNDNLNQTSASETCLLIGPDGTCFINRKVPPAIGSRGVNFEGSLSRREPLSGHSGIYLRSFAFGDIYPGHSRYNQVTSVTQIGYDHRTAHDTWAVAPTFDAGTYGTGLLYTAWGGHAEWIHDVNTNTTFKLEADRKQFRYKQPGYNAYDGALRDAFATFWYQLPRQWTVFGGLDLVDKDARDVTQGFIQRGARIGVVRAWGNAFTTYLSASFRYRDYAAYSELLEARRHDVERNLIFILGMPKFRFMGLTPSLTAQINRVRSNVGWLYSYQRRQVSFRLEHTF